MKQRYLPLLRFMLPLAVTGVIQEFGLQILNGGMARMPQATATLAAFGLAWGIVTFIASPLWPLRSMSLVLVNGRSSHRTLFRFYLLISLLLALQLVALTFGPLSHLVIERLHTLDATLGDLVRQTIFWLIPYPFFFGLLHFNSGLLLQAKRTEITSYATLTGIGLSLTAVFPLLETDLIRQNPILLPPLITYIAILPELLIVSLGCRRYVLPQLAADDEPVTFGYALRYIWPIAFVYFIQTFSRPMINLFIAREPNGADTLAVLTVVYALGHIPYGWLNELRSIQPAFRERPLSEIRRFATLCGAVSFGVMVVLFWTSLRDHIVANWIGLDERLVPLAAAPLVVFSFFPIVVAVRAYFTGIALTNHQTHVMAPSGPARLLAIFLFLLLLPWFNIVGGARAIIALLSGFWAETLVVWWGLRQAQPSGERSLSESKTSPM